MKIGILVDEIVPGSAPKLIGWPIRRLTELGVEAEAIVIIEKDHWEKYKEHYDFHLEGIKIRYLFPKFPKLLQRLNFKFPGMSFFSLHHIVSLFYANKGISLKEFDMIIAHCQYSTFAARNILKHCNIPFILLLWDPSTYTARKIYKKRLGWKYPFLYIFANILDRFALQKCKAIITSGKFHHEYLKKYSDKPLEVLSPGCFVIDKLPDFSKRIPMILTYDRWDIGNMPDIFLDILEKTENKEVTLTIGGFWHPEALRDSFQKEVENRKLKNRVKLLGHLNEENIMGLCEKAMVHVHPVHEAFGMQTLEAAGCGCPSIIPEGSGVTDLFEHGVSGFHPPVDDFNAIVNCINLIFNDKLLAERISLAAWEVAKKHTWIDYANSLRHIVEKYA